MSAPNSTLLIVDKEHELLNPSRDKNEGMRRTGEERRVLAWWDPGYIYIYMIYYDKGMELENNC